MTAMRRVGGKFRAGIDFYLTNYLKLNISGQILSDEHDTVAVSSGVGIGYEF